MALLLIDSQGGVYRTDIVAGTSTRLADYSLSFTDIAVTPDGRVFANTMTALYELDLDAGTATQRLALSGGANALASDAEGRLYIAGSGSSITVVSSDTFAVERSIALPSFTSSAGDIHINGDLLYFSTNSRTLLTLDLTDDSVVSNAYHGIFSLFGLHSEGGKLYALAANDIYEIDPQTGAALLTLDLPINISVFGAATLAGVQVVGGARDDVLLADGNGSHLLGRGGNDILIGSAVEDRLDGAAGRDHLHGLGGRDVLLGGAGNDVMEGGGGNDRLSGGAGRDLLAGGRGNDLLSGGSGRDVFIFNRGDGTDRITDFNGNQDVVEISLALMGPGPKTVARLLNRFAEETDDGVLFDFGARGSLIVEDATLADLQGAVLLV